MSHKYSVEYTDTFGGEANYSWVKRETIEVPEMTHYGYTGSTDGSYSRARKSYNREIVRLAKAVMGLTGIRGKTYHHGDLIEFRQYGSNTVMFITFED